MANEEFRKVEIAKSTMVSTDEIVTRVEEAQAQAC